MLTSSGTPAEFSISTLEGVSIPDGFDMEHPSQKTGDAFVRFVAFLPDQIPGFHPKKADMARFTLTIRYSLSWTDTKSVIESKVSPFLRAPAQCLRGRRKFLLTCREVLRHAAEIGHEDADLVVSSGKRGGLIRAGTEGLHGPGQFSQRGDVADREENTRGRDQDQKRIPRIQFVDPKKERRGLPRNRQDHDNPEIPGETERTPESVVRPAGRGEGKEIASRVPEGLECVGEIRESPFRGPGSFSEFPWRRPANFSTSDDARISPSLETRESKGPLSSLERRKKTGKILEHDVDSDRHDGSAPGVDGRRSGDPDVVGSAENIRTAPVDSRGTGGVRVPGTHPRIVIVLSPFPRKDLPCSSVRSHWTVPCSDPFLIRFFQRPSVHRMR